MRTKCVITGVGCVSAIGVGIEAMWDALGSGRSGLAPVSAFDASAFSCSAGGEVYEDDKPLSARNYVPKSYRKATKVMARDTQLAVAAASLAVRDAGIVTRQTEGEPSPATYNADELGCHIGAGLIAAEIEELSSAFVTAKDDRGEFSLKA